MKFCYMFTWAAYLFLYINQVAEKKVSPILKHTADHNGQTQHISSQMQTLSTDNI